jgi:hypothetical protein
VLPVSAAVLVGTLVWLGTPVYEVVDESADAAPAPA